MGDEIIHAWWYRFVVLAAVGLLICAIKKWWAS